MTRPTEKPTDRRELRADRILDAAGELMLAWGDRKVTIEDVARRAGVGKGTVYLHFSTKEILLLTVVMRAQLAMMERILASMRKDPEHVRPSEVAGRMYREQFDSPIMRFVLTSGTNPLHRLTEDARELVGETVAYRWRTLFEYWELLREHGVITADADAGEQVYAYSTTVIGHLMAEPLLREQGLIPPGQEARALLLTRSVRSLLERETVPNTEMRALQPKVVALFERLAERLRTEIGEQKRVERAP